MGLAERLSETPQATASYAVPAGWQPTVAYRPDGSADVTTIGVGVPGEDAWADEVRALGVHIPPDMAVRLVEVRHDPAAWVRRGQGEDAVTEAVVRRRYVVEPARGILDVDELLAAIGIKRPPATRPTGEAAFVIALADWQIGKTAYGQGSDQTIARVLDSLERAVARLKVERKRASVGPIVLAALGDMCEGTASQGGGVVITSDLGLTHQVRVVRRLLLEYVKALAPLTERLVIPVAPGNHDQAHRLLGIAAKASDSWAVDVACQVKDALDLAGGYDHVEVVVPPEDDLTTVVEAAGTIIGCTHGHVFRKGQGHAWWAKQGHARHPVATAHVLLTGHFHHLRVEVDGDRTWVQAPTIDAGSPWYDQRHGGHAALGTLTMIVQDGTWRGLEAR